MTERVAENGSIHGIDLLKLLAAYAVVSLHTSPFYQISRAGDFVWTKGIGRLAVPFFFIAAGYFFHESLERKGSNVSTLWGYLRRIASIYLIWCVLYLPTNFNWSEPIRRSAVESYLLSLLCSGPVYHLWYFPALISCICLLYFLSKSIKLEALLVLGIVLYLFSCLGDSYYALSRDSIAQPLIDWWIRIFSDTKNLVPNGFIFVTLGFWFAKIKPAIPSKRAFLIALFFACLVAAEAVILRLNNISKDHNTSLFLVPAASFLFLGARNWKVSTPMDYRLIRNASVLIYLVHPYVMRFTDLFHLPNLIAFLLVVSLSTGFSLLVVKSPFPMLRRLY